MSVLLRFFWVCVWAIFNAGNHPWLFLCHCILTDVFNVEILYLDYLLINSLRYTKHCANSVFFIYYQFDLCLNVWNVESNAVFLISIPVLNCLLICHPVIVSQSVLSTDNYIIQLSRLSQCTLATVNQRKVLSSRLKSLNVMSTSRKCSTPARIVCLLYKHSSLCL